MTDITGANAVADAVVDAGADAGADGRVDVCLVSMPYAAISRPSMALGLLKGILLGEGIATTVAHANLWFAEAVGLRLYGRCATQAPVPFLMGEWTFAEAAFPDSRDRDEQYLSELAAASRQVLSSDQDPDESLIGDMLALRAAATAFVDAAAHRVLATGARVVGCTSTFEQNVASLALLRRIHQLDPGVITMMGGANCETVMGQAVHRCFPWVDYVVSGEADGLIVDLCRLALTRGRDVETGDLPRGVLGPRHRGAGGPRSGPTEPPRALFRDLDSLPVPVYDDYFQDLARFSHRADIRPGLPVETSRGCWWGNIHQCTFCGLNGSSLGFRAKSPDRALTELTTLEDRYGISDFEAVDNIIDMNYFTSLLPKLAESDRPRRLFYEVKANLSRNHVEALVRAGITWVQPGIESLHSEVLRLMDKGVRGWQNIQLLKWARELGLRLSWSLLWGFPGERDEYYQAMAEWIPLLEHLQAPAALSRLRYDRYSVYHQQASQTGLILLPIPAMAYVYPLGNADLTDLTYFFTTDPDRVRLDPGAGSAGSLVSRPGVRAVHEATRHWRSVFNAPVRPILSVTDHGDALDIIDTRACADTQRVQLTGLDRAVYLACDAAPRPERIVEALARDHGVTASDPDVTDSLRRLIRARLVLPIDGRVLTLAVPGVIPDLTDESQFPGGHVFTNRAEVAMTRTA